jgi:oxygen-dependent protoporphyrinogen oxidase
VIGGGISGLVAARELLRGGLKVILLEAEDRLGGKIQTQAWGDVRMETGADSFLGRQPHGLRLVEELGLTGDLIRPDVFGGYVSTAAGLRKLPAGSVLGFPLSPWAAQRTGLLSARGALRAWLENFHRRPLEGPDVAIEPFVRKRFGSEVFEHMVDPILAGTRAGDPQELSLAAGLPAIDDAARTSGSVTRALKRARRQAGGPEAPPFFSLAGGMASLIEALAASIPEAEVRTGAAVGSIHRADDGYRVSFGSTEQAVVDAVVMATPAHHAAAVLRDIAPAASDLLARIAYASVAVIALDLPAPTAALPGSGLLVPRGRQRTLSAATWYSTKWPDSAPGENLIVRAFVGRSGRHPALDLDDAELVADVLVDLARLTGLTEIPSRSLVTRWDDGLPQYRVGHLSLVAEIERKLARDTNVVLCGAAYRGSGIPDCIAHATDVAERLLNRLQDGARVRP